MKRWLFVVCISVLFVPVAAQYVIRNYDVSLNLRSDGYINVTEKIKTEFTEARRGIFRIIPVEYDTGRGLTRRILVNLVGVFDEHENQLTTLVEKQGPNLSIRIGNEHVVHSPGTVITYVIRYEVFGAINWFDESNEWEPSAELYWNVVGDDWDTTIESSSFTITFPEVDSDGRVRMRVFAGEYGSREFVQLNGVGKVDSRPPLDLRLQLTRNTAIGVLAKPLAPYQGLTVVLSLPYDHIKKPSGVNWIRLFVLPNLGFFIPLVTLLAMWFFWNKFGRDPHGGPVVVQYDPPDDLSPSEAGAMIDEQVDKRDIAAGIVSLAVKGYLDVEFGPEEGIVFKRRPVLLIPKDSNADLTPFEDRLLRQLRKGGKTVTEDDLRKHVATDLPELSNRLYEALVRRGYYLRSPDSVRIAWAFGGIAVVVVLAFLSVLVSPFKHVLPSIVGGVLGAIIVTFFSIIMPRRTPMGAEAVKKVMGFEEFIRRAESQELDWRSKKDPTSALFEKYLPYAIAFDLTKEWARAFQDVLTEPPSWYHHPSGRFNVHLFTNELAHFSTTIASSAGTPPRSSGAGGGRSGFGGGGFSGGGFGGGGGRSW